MPKKSTRPKVRSTTAKASTKKKAPAKKAAVSRSPITYGPRHLKTSLPKSFRLHKPVRHPVRLPNVWQLTTTTALIIWKNKGLFLSLAVIYGILSLILVQDATSSANATNLKSTFEHLAHGHFAALSSSIGAFAILIGSTSSTSSSTSGPYQFIVVLISSLAIIWALRQIVAGKKVKVRDSYYRGMYPAIPFVLILLVICIQLIPFIIGAKLYTTVIVAGIAAQAIEKLVWFLVFAVLALWSLYMICSSLFALYIVTLPDMTPLKALRSARGLVRHRRWIVLSKVLYLPLALLVLIALIMLPVILVISPLSVAVFFILSLFALVIVHTYMYNLYRELLNE
jgi:hypothetical protein